MPWPMRLCHTSWAHICSKRDITVNTTRFECKRSQCANSCSVYILKKPLKYSPSNSPNPNFPHALYVNNWATSETKQKKWTQTETFSVLPGNKIVLLVLITAWHMGQLWGGPPMLPPHHNKAQKDSSNLTFFSFTHRATSHLVPFILSTPHPTQQPFNQVRRLLWELQGWPFIPH